MAHKKLSDIRRRTSKFPSSDCRRGVKIAKLGEVYCCGRGVRVTNGKLGSLEIKEKEKINVADSDDMRYLCSRKVVRRQSTKIALAGDGLIAQNMAPSIGC
jgi:hypothetical protein